MAEYEYSNAVEHPEHYTSGSVECIEAIRASMTPEEFAGYCKGNVIKYVWRYQKKGGSMDLEKAAVYLDWMVDAVKNMEGEEWYKEDGNG